MSILGFFLYKLNWRVQGVLFISHGNACTSMLPDSKIGIKFACISDAFLVDSHLGYKGGISLGPR